MTVDAVIEATEQLAKRRTIRAFRLGRYILIVAEGDLPSPAYEADIEPSPLKIFPQQYNLVQRLRAGNWLQVVVPYVHAELFAYPKDQCVVTVHHADGTDEVDIEESVTGLGQFAELVARDSHELTSRVSESTGTSPSLKFDEAFKNALANLPVYPPSHPDELTHVEVLETGGLFGGFAGFHHLYVRIQATRS
jgi:hypothetical protein